MVQITKDLAQQIIDEWQKIPNRKIIKRYTRDYDLKNWLYILVDTLHLDGGKAAGLGEDKPVRIASLQVRVFNRWCEETKRHEEVEEFYLHFP